MSIESIVRPFAAPDFAPASPFYTASKAPPQNIVMQFGRGGGGRTFNGSESTSASFYMTQYVNEKSDADWGSAF